MERHVEALHGFGLWATRRRPTSDPVLRAGDGIHLGLAEQASGPARDLAAQLVTVLEGGDPGPDPAVARLLPPPAYPDDEEAAAEFRRFTADDLTARQARQRSDGCSTTSRRPNGRARRRGAAVVAADRLTDLRLVLGSRLGC